MTEEQRLSNLCRCCGQDYVAGFTGLCRDCGEAVERFLAVRRGQLSAAGLAAKAAWRESHA